MHAIQCFYICLNTCNYDTEQETDISTFLVNSDILILKITAILAFISYSILFVFEFLWVKSYSHLYLVSFIQ